MSGIETSARGVKSHLFAIATVSLLTLVNIGLADVLKLEHIQLPDVLSNVVPITNIVFISFFARHWYRRERIPPVLYGALIPMAVFLTEKVIY